MAVNGSTVDTNETTARRRHFQRQSLASAIGRTGIARIRRRHRHNCQIGIDRGPV
ncbi:hypothetical protein [Natronolimnobius baerhuensis]|uniref:hypothetical protein n=1 Tax=Natronolimnobius baerhuensis TaxID=253108 RepID=UPI0015960740|nr:hypothetical protein [Natronolimnobius baerhuensis]